MLSEVAKGVLDWQSGKSAPPSRMMIAPTYRCNIDCGICIRNCYDKPEVFFDEVSDERWLRLIDEAHEMGIPIVTIAGGGEPFVRTKLIQQLCVKIKSYGMEGFIQTNGTLISDATIETLIECKWDHVTISIDAPNADVNDVIREKGVFDKTVKTLERLKEIKRKHGSNLPEAAIHMTVTALNYGYLKEMVDFCLEHGVEMISASPLLEPGLENTEYIMNEEQRLALPDKVHEVIRYAEEKGLLHTFHNLFQNEHECDCTAIMACVQKQQCTCPKHLADVHCLEPWVAINVYPSGQIMPCCFFCEPDAESIRDKSLEEVWNGPYLTEFRNRMRSEHIPEYCNGCYYPHVSKHVDLKNYVRTLVTQSPEIFPPWYTFPMKVMKSLRTHGVTGGIKRFHEWKNLKRTLNK